MTLLPAIRDTTTFAKLYPVRFPIAQNAGYYLYRLGRAITKPLPLAYPWLPQALRDFAELERTHAGGSLLSSEAHLAFRSSRGDANRTYFLELLPRIMEFREVEPGLFRDWLIAFRKNPQVRAEDVVRIRIRDTFLDQQARVEVEYQTAAASFSRHFTPGKIDSILQELLGAETPACDLGSAVPFLSEESRWKLNRLWTDKCSESFMPHELCNGLGIQPDEALRVMEALAAAGKGKMMQLAYHSCMEPPIKAVPAGTDLEFPFDCPECDGEIMAESQLRFGHMLRKVAP